MTLSDAGNKFICSYEKFDSKVYEDSGGNDTIGYGHKVEPGESFPANGITKEAGEELFKNDAQSKVAAVNTALTVQVTQNEFDALVSFCFNIGAGAFQNSTVLQNVNTSKPVTLDDFLLFKKTGGQVSQGLVNRRNDEYELFSAGDYVRNH